jgi:DNA polymerase III subunit epsilon
MPVMVVISGGIDLIDRVVLVIAHNADFDRRFLEKRLPAFATKHWACSRSDIDWKAEGIRSSALEFVAYSLGFFHDGHRAASDCRATLHAPAQLLPSTGRLTLQALVEKARLPTWRFGREMRPLRRRMSLRPEVTPGAQESSGDRDAGIVMCRTRAKRKRQLGSEQT